MPSPAAESQLLIDGHPILFPPVQVQVQGTSPVSVAVLSRKGPEAGNSFFLDMTLEDVEDLAGINGATWQLTRAEERTDDLLTTILIDGGAEQLQPQEVSVQFTFDGVTLRAKLSGRWGVFTTPDAVSPSRAVLVTGDLAATVTGSE